MRRVRRAAVAVVVAMVVAAGCGSDDDGSVGGATGDGGATTPASTAAADDEPATDDEPVADAAEAEAAETEPGTEVEPDDVAPDDVAPEAETEPFDPDAEPVDDLDSCALFEGADLDALLGVPAGPGEDEFHGHGHTCEIRALDEGSRARLTLRISTSHGPENHEGMREQVGVDSEVTGLGDAAFHSGPYLGVLLGERFLLLQVLGDSALSFRAADADLEAAMAVVVAALSD